LLSIRTKTHSEIGEQIETAIRRLAHYYTSRNASNSLHTFSVSSPETVAGAPERAVSHARYLLRRAFLDVLT